MTDAKKKCFVISPIGDSTSAIRAEADWLLKGVIKPALEPGYIVQRADAYPKNDVITNQVILAIQNADLIVADLTGHNPNVFYELAVAHAFNKPVVPMIRSDQAIPFDNHLMGTIFYSRDRFEAWEQAKVDLQQAAADIQKFDYKVTNPITIALGVGQLKVTGSDRDSIIAELSENVAALQADLRKLTRPPISSFNNAARLPISAASVNALLRTMYGPPFEQLSMEDRNIAYMNARAHLRKRETELERPISRKDAMDAIRSEYGDDVGNLTIPF